MKLSVLIPAVLICFASACSKGGSEPDPGEQPGGGEPAPTTIPLPSVTGDTSFSLAANADNVNVMGALPGRIPSYPQLAKKPGKLIGFVTDLSGKPIEGAYIGVRSSAVGGSYSYSSGTSNNKGYYEMDVPLGSVHFWAAGTLVNYAGATVPLGLHATDGQLGVFSSAGGAVKHFVLLSYGRANPADIVNRPWYSNNYYGGSIFLNYDIGDPNDIWRPVGSLPPNAEIIITLTPQDNFLYGEQKAFVIRKKVGNLHCNINNIPIGKYKIFARLADGRQLKLRSAGPTQHPVFGLKPVDVLGSSFITFIPTSSEASSAAPNRGDWKQVNVKVLLP